MLQQGFISYYSLEDTIVVWGLAIWHLQLLCFLMDCFCDIPIGRIQDHVGFYGTYDIGISKEWATRNMCNIIQSHIILASF